MTSPYGHDLLNVMDKKLCGECGSLAEHYCPTHEKYFCLMCGHAHVLNEHSRK
jgi:hypothetical protein